MSLKIIPALLLFCFSYSILCAQNKTYQIKADTVRIFNNCDTAELVLENRTRGLLNGVLTNKGNGVTEFRKVMVKLNDSTYIIGGDTLKVSGSIDSSKLNSMAWLLKGNTVGALKTLGTVDNFDLPVITNNIERMRVTAGGNVGIGTTTPKFSLDVNGGVASKAFYVSAPLFSWAQTNFYINDTTTRQGVIGMQVPPIRDGRDLFVSVGDNYTSTDYPIDGTGFRFDIRTGYGGGNQTTFWRNGNVTVGSNTYRLTHKLSVTGKGIFTDQLTTLGNALIGTTIDNGARLQVHGQLTVDTLNTGTNADSVVVVNNNLFKKIAQSSLGGGATGNSWNINANTVGAIKTLGTIDNFDLPIITNNIERLRVTAGGNVGIGTTSPVAKLQVDGSSRLNLINDNDNITIKSSGIQNWKPIMKFNITDPDGNSNSYGLNIEAYNAEGGNRILRFNQNNASSVYFTGGSYLFESMPVFGSGISNTYHKDFDIVLKANTLNPNPIGIKFYAENFSSNPIMSIMQTGNIGVGTTSPAEKFEVIGNIKTTGFILPTGAATGKVLTSDANGNATWQTPGVPSDFNLKENISISQFNTNKIFGLTIKDFNYKTDKTKTRYTGLIAQELKMQIPELVLGNEGNYSIDYVKMVPYLLKAIQEQQSMIQQQQKEITQLKQQPVAANNAGATDVLVLVQQLQQQLLQQQEEIKTLKELIKIK
jgi:Chaperone of endosialidase